MLPLDELTREQKCAAFGIGVDLSGDVQNQDQMSRLDDLMDDFRRNLGLRRAEIEEFMLKMQSEGRLSYAITILKTNQNNKGIWAIYEWLYRVAAILESQSALDKLDNIYINDFGWSTQKLQDIRKYHNFSDTITKSPKRSTPPISNTGNRGGCIILALTILSSFIFCFIGFIVAII
ncbi:hypothetical protein [Prevotella sp. P6B1]|uniref:hypothetical protein n=1 Tax=Prevotella sp. P6B1 TaxID=1410613 RepID=UPI00051C5632|nr:hypothetical protein [Prevotella sp. P6B1]